MTTEIEHGTVAGESRHRRLKEPVCDACRQAATEARRARRAAKKAAEQPEPVAAETAAPAAIPEGWIRYISVATERAGGWSSATGAINPDSTEQLSLGAEPALTAERMVEQVLRDIAQGASIVLIGTTDLLTLRELAPDFGNVVQALGAKVVVCGDDVTPIYSGDDVTRAERLAAEKVKLIVHGERVRRDREILEREQGNGETGGRRIVAAVIHRERDWMGLADQRYIVPEVEYEPIPAGHRALTQETYVGTILPPKKGSRGWTGHGR